MDWFHFTHANLNFLKKTDDIILVGCGQNWAWLDSVGQSDCNIFKSNISQEPSHESVLFFYVI